VEFQESELVSLVLAFVFVIVLGILYRADHLPRLPAIYAAAALLILSNIATVLEGFFWYSFLNTLEHVCYAASGLLFALACWRLAAQVRTEQDARP